MTFNPETIAAVESLIAHIRAGTPRPETIAHETPINPVELEEVVNHGSMKFLPADLDILAEAGSEWMVRNRKPDKNGMMPPLQVKQWRTVIRHRLFWASITAPSSAWAASTLCNPIAAHTNL
jgi:hypothetical protein